LTSDNLFEKHPYPVFEEFAREELQPADYTDMLKCFLLNDVYNINSKMGDESSPAMKSPSFYTEDELEEGLAEPDELFDFFSDFIWDIRLERQNNFVMPRENELLFRMISSLVAEEESVIKGFPREYLIFKARLKNLTTALACRKNGRPYEILPFDHFSSRIGISQAPDFGLGDELGVMESLIDRFTDSSALDIERSITKTSWVWLEEKIAYRHFSREAVFSFAIRIADIERWLAITPAAGRKMLDELIENLHEYIELPKEYSL